MARETNPIIADDVAFIRKGLQKFSSYDFAKDIAERMQGLGLSQNALAARARVSHTMVGNWLHDGAKPNGKERFKELGMALGMRAAELKEFLQRNSYPGLYVKNPLDVACRFVLAASAGQENVVRDYRECIQRHHLEDYTLQEDLVDIATTMMSRDFDRVTSTGSMDQWLRMHGNHFRAYGKTYIPHARLVQFILLFISGQTINNLYITGELPLTVRNLLFPLLADKEIAVRGLRAKLIVFGLYENMTEDEIDAMLGIAQLRLITNPAARIDQVILSALRRAHERYPYFVLCNAEKVLENMEKGEEMEWYGLYREKKRQVRELIRHYERKKNERDRLFEQHYTNYQDKNLLHYLSDIFDQLVSTGDLTAGETEEYTALMRTYSNRERNVP